MRASDLGLSQKSIDYIVEYGAETLYEPQAAAVDAGLLKGQSMVVAAPTASGKSLVAMMAILAMLEGGGRAGSISEPAACLGLREAGRVCRPAKGVPQRGKGIRIHRRAEHPGQAGGKHTVPYQRENGSCPAKGRAVAGGGGLGHSRRDTHGGRPAPGFNPGDGAEPAERRRQADGGPLGNHIQRGGDRTMVAQQAGHQHLEARQADRGRLRRLPRGHVRRQFVQHKVQLPGPRRRPGAGQYLKRGPSADIREHPKGRPVTGIQGGGGRLQDAGAGSGKGVAGRIQKGAQVRREHRTGRRSGSPHGEGRGVPPCGPERKMPPRGGGYVPQRTHQDTGRHSHPGRRRQPSRPQGGHIQPGPDTTRSTARTCP